MKDLVKKAYEYGKKHIEFGKAADYIPELAVADITDLAIAVLDKDGKIYSHGMIDKRFSVQSILKVLYYLLVLENVDSKEVSKALDVKPTALGFNSILDLDMADKPRNPMVNAGAMTSVGLLYEHVGGDVYEMIIDRLRDITQDPTIDYSKEIYQSEMSTAYNNIALINMLVGKGVLPDTIDRDKVLSTYIKTCASMVNVCNLVQFAGVIANDGIDPLSGERKFDEKYGRKLRTIMATSGMYNQAGEFAMDVGLPAKSGVGGGIIAASKDGLAIATYCPGLDEAGNSLAGVKMLEMLSDELDLSIY